MYRNTNINSKGVKTMRSLKIAAAAMALAMPGMAMAATDGSLGATSTGTFNTSVNILSPTGTNVQIIGLDDFNFGTIQTSNSSDTSIAPISDFFCMNQSGDNKTDVLVSFTQVGANPNDLLSLKDASGNSVGMYVVFKNPDNIGGGTAIPTSHYNFSRKLSGTGCTSSTTDSATAHTLTVNLNAIPAGASGSTGALSGQFSILIGPAS
jgi:hypothetical protein